MTPKVYVVRECPWCAKLVQSIKASSLDVTLVDASTLHASQRPAYVPCVELGDGVVKYGKSAFDWVNESIASVSAGGQGGDDDDLLACGSGLPSLVMGLDGRTVRMDEYAPCSEQAGGIGGGSSGSSSGLPALDAPKVAMSPEEIMKLRQGHLPIAPVVRA